MQSRLFNFFFKGLCNHHYVFLTYLDHRAVRVERCTKCGKIKKIKVVGKIE